MDNSKSASSNPTLRTRTSSVNWFSTMSPTHPPPDHRFAANNFGHTSNLSPLASPSPAPSPDQPKSHFKPPKPIPHGSNPTNHNISYRYIVSYDAHHLNPMGDLGTIQMDGMDRNQSVNALRPNLLSITTRGGKPIIDTGRGPMIFLFPGFYIIVFSFIRQTVTEFISSNLTPDTSAYEGPSRIDLSIRDMRSSIGSVMANQPTWWYNTAEFWRGYPHWRMEPVTKTYYLLQFSYWLQQMLLASH
ncbi:hypothetical protein Pst134EB_023243 [Puccinia striiformis f. sp. tritici]|nr:hypothetical protein Pst134EB_023243 [Puccinia striiformis f. sp. tritici]